MSATRILPHKRGATFSYAGTVLLASGTWSAAAQVKRLNAGALELIDDLDVDLVPLGSPTDTATHTITIVGTSTQTAAWPIAKLQCDVRFSDASTPPLVVPSPTFVIDLVQEVTDVA